MVQSRIRDEEWLIEKNGYLTRSTLAPCASTRPSTAPHSATACPESRVRHTSSCHHLTAAILAAVRQKIHLSYCPKATVANLRGQLFSSWHRS